MSLGGFLGSVPQEMAQGMLAEAQRANQHPVAHFEDERLAAEAAASVCVEQLLKPPENLFVPFTVPGKGDEGKVLKQAQPDVHWAHVDSGAQVCIVHEGVVQAFPHFMQYHQEF